MQDHRIIIKEYYQKVMCHFCDTMKCKHPKMWAASNWQFHHNNTHAYSSDLLQSFLAKHNTPVLHQASYSTDMAPCDFWLFLKLKMLLKGAVQRNIMQNATDQLNNHLKKGIQALLPTVAELLEKVCGNLRGLH